MRPPISYFGGKTAMAPWIAAVLPPHEVYIEPFCGSAAVLFAKQASRCELVNDVDGELVNFFRQVRDNPDALAEACTWTPYAREELLLAHQPAIDPLERARRFWVRSTQSFNGRVSKTRSWGTSFAQHTWRPFTVQNRLERLRAAAKRLLNVAIEHGDALQCIERFAADGCVMYVDPPYPFASRSGEPTDTRRSGYEHEFGTEIEHRALAEVLHRAPGTIILSSYPNALYDELYEGWARLERDVAVNTSHGRGEKAKRAVEVIWSSVPLHAQGRLDLETHATPPTRAREGSP